MPLTHLFSIYICAHGTVFSPSQNVEFLEDRLDLTHLSPQDVATAYLGALNNYLSSWTNLKGNEERKKYVLNKIEHITQTSLKSA